MRIALIYASVGQELQRALDLAERAKQHDKLKEFAPAFELYKEALEYFMSAARREYLGLR